MRRSQPEVNLFTLLCSPRSNITTTLGAIKKMRHEITVLIAGSSLAARRRTMAITQAQQARNPLFSALILQCKSLHLLQSPSQRQDCNARSAATASRAVAGLLREYALYTGYAANTSMTAVRPNAVSVASGYHSAYQGSAMQAPHGASQGLHVSTPNNTADYEALRNQAHETYRNGDFHRALQLCQSVRQLFPC